MMDHKGVRIALFALNVFVGLTAVAGGIGFLTGGLQMPLEWLRDTPFSDYTIPGLVLAIVVGGSTVVAAVMMPIQHEAGVLASALAGVMLVGWIAVEVAMIGLVNWLQPFYFVLGLLIFGLAVYLRTTTTQRHHAQSGIG